MNATATTRRSLGDRLLTGIERMGNKLPEPFALFTILFLLTAAVSTAMAWAHVQVQVPGTEDPVAVRGLFTGEGIAWFTTTVGENLSLIHI